ncbi:hypothetical protein AB0E08_13615 [Streptomyces sp. NPDC048281]|uniref:hypothetical protein n=1 Tax=Streptomyces sp. NPDC048281 TaxID=3154715 RepID=UPI003441EEB4
MPVPVVGDESVDVAILDTLHGYARSRNRQVSAVISDLSAEYVAVVEVSPDGSSRLVEERRKEPVSGPEALGSVDLGKPVSSSGDARAPGAGVDAPEVVPSPVSRLGVPGVLGADQEGRRSRDMGQSDDEYEAPGLLRRRVVVSVGVGVALLVVGPLIVLGSGSGSKDKAQAVDAAGDRSGAPVVPAPTQPTVTASPSMWPHATSGLSPSPDASASASLSAAPSHSASPKETRTAEPDRTPARVTPPSVPHAPHRQTAAEAVMKRAASSPGRHICYRVYLDKGGWQKPVCDGAAAGSVGTRQKIKSINTATAGTKGTSSNAWVHVGHWKTPWSGATADGVDVYIGSTKASSPYILGLVINVGDGAVCENAAVNGQWGGLTCDNPTAQPPVSYVWGGTMDDSQWLQAVRFTV